MSSRQIWTVVTIISIGILILVLRHTAPGQEAVHVAAHACGKVLEGVANAAITIGAIILAANGAYRLYTTTREGLRFLRTRSH